MVCRCTVKYLCYISWLGMLLDWCLHTEMDAKYRYWEIYFINIHWNLPSHNLPLNHLSYLLQMNYSEIYLSIDSKTFVTATYNNNPKTIHISLINLSGLLAQNYLFFAAVCWGKRPRRHMLASRITKFSVRSFLLASGAATRTDSSG